MEDSKKLHEFTNCQNLKCPIFKDSGKFVKQTLSFFPTAIKDFLSTLKLFQDNKKNLVLHSHMDIRPNSELWQSSHKNADIFFANLQIMDFLKQVYFELKCKDAYQNAFYCRNSNYEIDQKILTEMNCYLKSGLHDILQIINSKINRAKEPCLDYLIPFYLELILALIVKIIEIVTSENFEEDLKTLESIRHIMRTPKFTGSYTGQHSRKAAYKEITKTEPIANAVKFDYSWGKQENTKPYIFEYQLKKVFCTSLGILDTLLPKTHQIYTYLVTPLQRKTSIQVKISSNLYFSFPETTENETMILMTVAKKELGFNLETIDMLNKTLSQSKDLFEIYSIKPAYGGIQLCMGMKDLLLSELEKTKAKKKINKNAKSANQELLLPKIQPPQGNYKNQIGTSQDKKDKASAEKNTFRKVIKPPKSVDKKEDDDSKNPS